MHRSQTSRAGSPETSTASSGSATDPPNTSVPADKYVDRYLEYRKALLIKILMDMVGEYLDETICTLEEATDYEGQDPNDSGRSGSRGIKRAASYGNMNPGHKRQNRGDDEDEENFDGNDRDDREPSKKKTKPDPESEKLRFACPFYKRDPHRYKNHRACRGPGWTEMHRLKEHLYRQHRLFTCGRCLEHFKKDESLQEHVRAEKACTLSSRKMDPAEGMSMETEKQIKSRRQGKQDKLDKLDDTGRWFEIYHILFGDVNIGDLPSPYYEDASGSSNGTNGPAAPGALQTQYRHFLRREIPNMVKRELEAEVAKSFKDVGSTMRGRLTTMIQNSVAKCAKIFEYIPTPSEAASHGDPDDGGDRLKSRESPPPPASTVAPAPTTDNFIGLPDDILDFNFDVDFNLEALSSFYPSVDAQTYDPCFQGIDSAYESGSIGGSSGTYMT
ncbi:hypothetical protein CKAH01_01820 [Colletotrichum kahawae]|uniref:C2H2-type domain-containing protein n=1 Tax=Colletotrichum kahawae TaxID=34407 RepID=A0AAD9Y2K4_COLKA|nr:hypothetical protein CKAH01_01820 [Colletotrichum kahawae]